MFDSLLHCFFLSDAQSALGWQPPQTQVFASFSPRRLRHCFFSSEAHASVAPGSSAYLARHAFRGVHEHAFRYFRFVQSFSSNATHPGWGRVLRGGLGAASRQVRSSTRDGQTSPGPRESTARVRVSASTPARETTATPSATLLTTTRPLGKNG